MSRLVVVLTALLLSSCEQVVVTTVDADRIDIAPPTSFVKVSETTRLTVTVLSRDGRTLSGRAVAWTSLDPAIAEVDASGLVRGLTPGAATIRATTEGALGTATVNVTSGPAIAAAPQDVEFTAVQNGATPGDRTVNITNAGDGALNGLTVTITYAPGQASGWLAASLAGTAPTTLVLSATQAGLALGTYTATVAVASPDASNSPVAVTVRLTVLAPQPAIALGATTAGFTAPQGGADPAQQDIGVTNAGGGTLTGLTATVGFTSGQPTGWLTASLAAGTAPTTLTLRAATGSLPQGSYTAAVQVGSPVAQNNPQTVNVTFTVGAAQPNIGVSPPTLSFTGVKAGANPATESVQVTNTGGGSLAGLAISVTYPGGQPAGWVTTSLSGTTAPATITVGAVTGALDVGTYTATIRVTAPDAVNSPQSIDVSFQVQQQPAAIAVSPNNVSFSTTPLTGDPAAQQVAITNAGSGTLSGLTRSVSYTAGEPAGWLTADLPATTAPTTLTLTARIGSLAIGTYNAKVRIASAGASNSPVDITVTFTIAAAPPAMPGAAAASAVSDRRINVSWTDQSNNESRFDIERSNDGLTGWTVIGSAGPNQTAFADSTGLTGSSTYFYRVGACNAIGCSTNLTVAAATTAPNTPTNLTTTATASTKVDLTWSDNSPDETGFPIERSSNGGQTWTVIGTAAAGATAYGDGTAAPLTTYRYRVRACRNTVCSRYSTESQVTTGSAPAVPTAVAASATSPTRIDIAWTDNSTNETQFRIEARTAATAYAQVGTAAANTPSFSHTGLNAKTQYFYRVRACTATECSSYSTEASATTLPNAPTGLTATAPSHSQVDLSWTAPPETVTGYSIERRVGTAAFAPLANVTGGSTTTYTDTNVQATTTYTYRVQACDNTLCSAFSNEAPVTTPAPPPPGAPTGLDASAVSSSRIDLTWAAASGTPQKYYIERKTTSLGTYAVIDSVAGSTLSYQNTGLSSSTEYWYRVRACSASGCSGYSNEDSAITLLAAPSAPANAQATAVSSSQIDLVWGAAAGTVDRYRIQRKTGSAGSFAVIDSVAGSALSYQDTGLAPATQYFYRVQACNSGGCSDYSAETSAVTAQAPPGAPSGLTANAASSERIDLAWNASSGSVSRYRIERKNNTLAGDYAVVDSVAGGTLVYQSTGLSPLTSYSYRVHACNAAGCSGYSNEATASTPGLPAPNAPANLAADAISGTQISLTWTHDGLLLVGSFEIERAPSTAQSDFTPLQTVAGTARSYVDGGLTSATTYYYRLRACNLAGCSAWSSVANAKTQSPATPTNVAAVATSASTVTVSWTPPGGQTYYVIRRRVNGTGAPTTITVSDANATSYADSGLSSQTRYTYEVRACGPGNSCSSYSAAVSATTQ